MHRKSVHPFFASYDIYLSDGSFDVDCEIATRFNIGNNLSELHRGGAIGLVSGIDQRDGLAASPEAII
jgi:hypothetical protein